MDLENKVIISVAPVSPLPHYIDYGLLAKDIAGCESEGAAMVHLHVRDKNGFLTDNVDDFAECVNALKSSSNIIIQASTGGISEMNINQRCAPLFLSEVETCSLNVGSVNLGGAVYKNSPDDIETCIEIILKQKKMPEIEIFELGMIETVRKLDFKYNLPKPIMMNLVMGHEGGCPANPKALTALWHYLNEDLWGFTQANRRDFRLMSCALGLGARLVRIGLEDSPYLDGSIVTENTPLVAGLAKLIRSIGLEPATPEEARKILGLEVI